MSINLVKIEVGKDALNVSMCMKMKSELRNQILKRDNHTCQHCFKTPSILHVHHIIPRSSNGSDEPTNLITLCPSCHRTAEPRNCAEIRVQKSVILFDTQIDAVQKFANENYDGDLSQGLRKIVRLWMEANDR